jgi:hypothetical protein
LKYKYFYSFLLLHNKEVAEEVCKTYINTIGKIYFSNFQNYVNNLIKLEIKIGQATELIVEKEVSTISSLLSTFGSKSSIIKSTPYERY